MTVPGEEALITSKDGISYSMGQYLYVTGSLLGGRKSLDLIGAAKQKERRLSLIHISSWIMAIYGKLMLENAL